MYVNNSVYIVDNEELDAIQDPDYETESNASSDEEDIEYTETVMEYQETV